MAAQKPSGYKPMLEKFFEQLEGAKQPKTFYEIADQIMDKKLGTDEKGEVLARLYTNINLDGRFLSVGDNFWGLKRWYPIEQREEDVAMTLAPKRKKKASDNDDFDDYDDDLEDYDELDMSEDVEEEDVEEGFKKPIKPVSDFDANGDLDEDDDVEEEPIGDTIIDLEDDDEDDDDEKEEK